MNSKRIKYISAILSEEQISCLKKLGFRHRPDLGFVGIDAYALPRHFVGGSEYYYRTLHIFMRKDRTPGTFKIEDHFSEKGTHEINEGQTLEDFLTSIPLVKVEREKI